MLTVNVPKANDQLTVVPQCPQVVLSEDVAGPLALLIPPLTDIAEIDALKASLVSLNSIAEKFEEERKIQLRLELEAQKRKLKRFAESPKFLNRLAVLAAAAGDRAQEAEFLVRASEWADSAFFAHRLGDNLASTGNEEEAKKLFEAMDLDTDAQANLKLAALHVRHSNLEAASRYVRKAVDIDPLDFSVRLFDGALSLFNQEYEKAIHSFRIASEDRPGSSALFANLGIAYEKLGLSDKALSALKRSAALDPLNVNAILLLADVAHGHGRDEDALPSLRYFVQFEQTESDVWARLARAALHLGQYEEAVAALKRQATIRDTSEVWNNLGVVYGRSGQQQKALSAFKHAMTKATGGDPRDYFLPARNIAQAFSAVLKPDDVLAITAPLIARDSTNVLVTDDQLSDVYAFHIHALRRLARIREMVDLTNTLLARPDLADPLRQWLVGYFVAHLALVQHDRESVLSFVNSMKGWLENAKPRDDWRRSLLFNNVAFALAEFGMVSDAEIFLSRIQSAIYKEPYPTATFGLIQFRRGKLDRAVELYERATQLATTKADKLRIKQKLNLELGIYWAPKQPSKARRLFERVVAEKGGDPSLVKLAQKEMVALQDKRM